MIFAVCGAGGLSYEEELKTIRATGFEGTFIGNPKFQTLNEKLEEIAGKYSITPTGLAIAWILRHPACMQPIVGSVNPQRLQQICDASDVTITRQEWYDLYCSTGKKLP